MSTPSSRAFGDAEELRHVHQTFCCGPSSGGYAAILFGHYLQVDVVYAFAPVTLIDLTDLKKYGGRKECSRITEQHRDLARLLAQHNGRTRYKIFFCDGHARDRTYAARIQACLASALPTAGNLRIMSSRPFMRGVSCANF